MLVDLTVSTVCPVQCCYQTLALDTALGHEAATFIPTSISECHVLQGIQKRMAFFTLKELQF